MIGKKLRILALLPLSAFAFTACGDDTSQTDSAESSSGDDGTDDVDPSDDDAPPTDDGVDSTTDDVDTTVGTSADDTTTDATGTDDDPDSTTGGPLGPYAPCDVHGDPEACGDEQICIAGQCLPVGCRTAADCPQPDSGTATVLCDEFVQNGEGVLECFQTCLEGETCSDGQVCFGEQICVVQVDDWNCFPDFYGDSECDCGCGIVDVDCADATLESCEWCNDNGSCSVSSCDSNVDINPVDNGTCVPPVEGWTCSAAYYDADDGCHCGCGIADPDCDAAGIEACEVCDVNGSCSQGVDCSALLDPANPGECVWTCNPLYYGDEDCDCGCGIVDVDCADATLAACEWCDNPGSCSTEACATNVDIDPTDNSTCLSGVEGWTCSAAFYDAGDGCHCGCGIPDPDCEGGGIEACEICDANGSCSQGTACSTLLDPTDTGSCLWNCDPLTYGDDECTCGCGLPDIDCGENPTIDSCESCNAVGSCSTFACAGDIDPADVTACVDPIEGWTCATSFYEDGTCHCGCGIADPDCGEGEACEVCDAPGSCAAGADDCAPLIDPENSGECAWTCSPSWYGDTECDCGCGVLDSDCADDAGIDECVTCVGCQGFSCPGNVSPDDITQCVVPTEGWTCLATAYEDGICHCGCGAPDPDCDSSDIAACDDCNAPGACSVAVPDACETFLVPGNNAECVWTCSGAYYGDGWCDCGCGIVDVDCEDASADACLFCNNPGSCAEDEVDCDPIADDDNATCEAA